MDAGSNEVLRFENAAGLIYGEFSSTSAFPLDAENSNPTGLTTDGQRFWVVDDNNDSVFIYDLAGTTLGSWQLDAGNTDPSGITNDANGGNSLWTVDRSGTVFHYALSVPRVSGSLVATNSFVLDSRNQSPEGIADPPQSQDGDSLLDENSRVEFNSQEDFEDANFFSVNTEDVPGSLTLNAAGEEELFPFIWIANFGEGTISKFDVTTGQELGRYRTGPESIGGGLQPSRVAVDGEGNVWVANRAEGIQTSIVKVLNDGFIDRNNNGVIDSVVDINGDGQVKLDEVLPWDANADGLPDDERIVMSITVGRNRNNPDQFVPGGLARAIAIDAEDRIWVGLYNFYQYEVYDSNSGDLIDIVPTTGRPYGAAVDGSGTLWSAAISEQRLQRIHIGSMQEIDSIAIGQTYGVTVAPNGVIWGAGWTDRRIYRYDPTTGETRYYGTPNNESQIRGIAVDRNGDVWASSSNSNRVIKYDFDVDGKTLLGNTIIGVGSEPTAVVMDAEGFIWTTARGNDTAWKIDPETNLVVDGWPITTGRDPYNYSDMTGVIRLTVTERRGTWTEIIDSEILDTQWGAVATRSFLPTGTDLRIRVRSSNDRDQLQFLTWSEVLDGQPLFDSWGRYVEVELELSSSDPDANPSVDRIVVQAVQSPSIVVAGLVNDMQLPIGNLAIQEIATAFSPELIDTSLANQIVTVRINGTPVNVLDQNGNFFADYELRPGWNELAIEAVDIYGLSSTRLVRLFGSTTASAIDFDQFIDITGSFSGVYGRTSFDQRSETLFVDLATRNDGLFTTKVPLFVGVKNVSDPLVQVLDADGTAPDGIPFYDFSDFVNGGSLEPAELTGSPTVSFFNPGRKRFDYELVFYTKLNQAPEIVSLPRIEALVGRSYEYNVDAVDPDNDVLTYSLPQHPTGMRIDSDSGLITWQPESADIGNYDITVRGCRRPRRPHRATFCPFGYSATSQSPAGHHQRSSDRGDSR